MQKVFLEDVRRSFKSSYFWLAAAATLLCCLFAPGINMFKVDLTLPDKSVLEEAFTLSREQFKTDFAYSSFNIFSFSIGANLPCYIPLIAALPFIPLYCDEKKSGFQRFVMHRVSKRKYYLAKIGAAACSGVAAVVLGLALMLVFCYVVYPPINTYPQDVYEYYKDFVNGTCAYAPLCLAAGGLPAALVSLLYGMVSAAVGATLSLLIVSFTANKYIALGLPVLLYDVVGKILYFSPYWEVAMRFSPFNLTAPSPKTMAELWLLEAYALLLFMAFAALFYFNSKRRDRYGL